ncbi:hypothetical protein KCU68_g247, partial [Aureobasidium melanogenum]
MKEGVPQTSCSCRGVPRTSRILERDCQNRAKGKDALDIRSEREVTHKVLRPHAPEILLGIVLLFPGGLEACPGRAFVHLLHGLKGVSGYIAAHGMCSVAVAVEQSVRLLRTQEGFENALTGEGDELLKRPRRYRPACRRVLDTAHSIPPAPRMTGSMIRAPNFLPSAVKASREVLILEKERTGPNSSSMPAGGSTTHLPSCILTSGKSNQWPRPEYHSTFLLYVDGSDRSMVPMRFRERYRRFVCSTGEHDVAVTTSGMCSEPEEL